MLFKPGAGRIVKLNLRTGAVQCSRLGPQSSPEAGQNVWHSRVALFFIIKSHYCYYRFWSSRSWSVVAGAQYIALVGFAGLFLPAAHLLFLDISHTLLLYLLVPVWCHIYNYSELVLSVPVSDKISRILILISRPILDISPKLISIHQPTLEIAGISRPPFREMPWLREQLGAF